MSSPCILYCVNSLEAGKIQPGLVITNATINLFLSIFDIFALFVVIRSSLMVFYSIRYVAKKHPPEKTPAL